MESAKENRLAFYETVGSVLWLYMDACWLFAWNLGIALLIAPTIFCNLAVFRYTEKSVPQISVAAAMNSWLLMNSLWMIGDIWKIPALLWWAKVVLIIGTVFLLVAFFKSDWRKGAWQTVMRRFRRLRIRQ